MVQNAAMPNILFIQTDQLTANVLSMYGDHYTYPEKFRTTSQEDDTSAPLSTGMGHNLSGELYCQTPHLDELAQNGVVFETAYCNFPLCSPSRASMMSGQLASRIGAFDNAAELCATIPTYAHYLRDVGYQTYLSGKMHFIGPDQLHGFEERLTTNLYPADFSWAPNWGNEGDRDTNDSRAVTVSGVCTRSVQIDHDDLVTFNAVQKLYDIAHADDERPFFMQVSYTHPHEPFLCTQEQWDRYHNIDIPLPTVGPLSAADHDPHSLRILEQFDMIDKTFTDDDILRSKRAYYGAVSYLDDKVGELLAALKATGAEQNTVILFTSDHGEMLGERGMWFKKTFFENSIRIPLILYGPAYFKPERVHEFASLVDLLPTFLGIATDGKWSSTIEPLDGADLTTYLGNHAGSSTRPIYAEYLSETTTAPILMIRRGQYKFVYCRTDPDQLYDVIADPNEKNNLAQDESAAELIATFRQEVQAQWDEEQLTAQIRLSQQRRQLIRRAMQQGKPTSWNHDEPPNADVPWYRGKEGYNEWAFDYLP